MILVFPGSGILEAGFLEAFGESGNLFVGFIDVCSITTYIYGHPNSPFCDSGNQAYGADLQVIRLK